MGLTCTCKRFLCCKTECTQNPHGSLYGIRSDLPKSYTRHVPLHIFIPSKENGTPFTSKTGRVLVWSVKSLVLLGLRFRITMLIQSDFPTLANILST